MEGNIPILAVDLGGLKIKGALYHKNTLDIIVKKDVSYTKEGLIDGKGYLNSALGIIKELTRHIENRKAYLNISSQRASMVGWSKDLDIITPIYTWKHKASIGILEKIREEHELGPLELFLQPGSGILRVKYLLDNYSGIDFLGSIESLLIYSLYNINITSYSLAYPYGAIDPFSLNWIDELLNVLGVPLELLPEIHEEKMAGYSTVIDGVTLELGAVIADQSSSLIGNGCLTEGLGKISMGTGCFLDVFTGDNFIGDPYQGVNPMLVIVSKGQPKFMAEYFIYHWGDVLDWINSNFGEVGRLELFKETGSLPLVIPTPDFITTEYKDLVNGIKMERIALHHDLDDISVGIIYALSYLLQRGYRRLSDLLSIEKIYLDGGWSMSPNVSKLISSILSRKVYLRRWRHLSPIIGSIVLMLSDGLNDVNVIVDNLNPVVEVLDPVKLPKYYNEYVKFMDDLLKELA